MSLGTEIIKISSRHGFPLLQREIQSLFYKAIHFTNIMFRLEQRLSVPVLIRLVEM